MDIDKNYVEDIFRLLKGRGVSRIEKIIKQRSLFYSCFKTHVVSFIFGICHRLNQTLDTQYLAVELFNRYYILSVIYNIESKGMKYSSRKSVDFTKINNNFLIEIFVCILIASKFNESSGVRKVIHNNKIYKELSTIGSQYSLKEIFKMEKSILKQLNFEVFIPTLLTYVELIIAKLNSTIRINSVSVHEKCCHIVDLAYIHHNEIYQKLNFLITREWEWSLERRFHFQPIENNRLLLGSAIVYTALTLEGPIPSDLSNKILRKLETICDIHRNDIGALSRIMCEICIL